MVNYAQAKVYKIVDNTNGNIYVGSTCEPTLARRLAGHVVNYKRYLNEKYHYVTSFKILENNDYAIVLLETCENITTKDELHARERIYIETLDCVNRYIPSRKLKEYKQVNKDKINTYKKKYYTNNKEQTKIYREANREKSRTYNKEYREANRDKLNNYSRDYYAKKKQLKGLPIEEIETQLN